VGFPFGGISGGPCKAHVQRSRPYITDGREAGAVASIEAPFHQQMWLFKPPADAGEAARTASFIVPSTRPTARGNPDGACAPQTRPR